MARLNNHRGPRGLRCSDCLRPLHMPQAGLVADALSACPPLGWPSHVPGGGSLVLAPWWPWVSSEARLAHGVPEPQKSAVWSSRTGGRGVLCGAPTGHCMFAPLFSREWVSTPGLRNCGTPFSACRGCRLWDGFAAPWSWLLSDRVPLPYAVSLPHVPLFFLCLPFGARLLRSWHLCCLFLVYLCKGRTVLNSSTDLFAPWLDLAAVSCSGHCFLPCHFPGLRSLPHPCCPWYLSQLPV